MSKICISCGAVLDDNALFCDDCGAKQDIRQREQELQIIDAEVDTKELGEESVSPPVASVEDDRQEQTGSEAVRQPYQIPETVGEPQLKQSKMGIAALVMGVIAIVSLGSLIVFDILGIIFGIVGMRKRDTKTGFAKAGLILSIIATVIIIIVMAVAIIFGW